MVNNTAKATSFSLQFVGLIRQNLYFFVLFILFILVGGINLMRLEQGDLLLYFNENRSYGGDLFFKYGTRLGEEWAFIAVLVSFLFIRFRYALLIPLTGLIVTLISFVSKNFFLHPRPSEYYKTLGTLNDINVVEGVHLVKGLSSFPSGHTMAGFALFSITAFLLNQKKGVALLLFFCALVVGISRIYLAQHFLKDVYLGAIMGVLIAMVLYAFQATYPINKASKIDGSIKFYA